jgi:hypothetical protein
MLWGDAVDAQVQSIAHAEHMASAMKKPPEGGCLAGA